MFINDIVDALYEKYSLTHDCAITGELLNHGHLIVKSLLKPRGIVVRYNLIFSERTCKTLFSFMQYIPHNFDDAMFLSQIIVDLQERYPGYDYDISDPILLDQINGDIMKLDKLTMIDWRKI